MSENEPAPAQHIMTTQSIVAVLVMLIFAATVGAVILWGDPAVRAQTVGGVIGIAGMVVGFYFTSSVVSSTAKTKVETTTKPDDPNAGGATTTTKTET